ncbi:hypothetical protein KIL84_007401, partial [Mauremys mutica]
SLSRDWKYLPCRLAAAMGKDTADSVEIQKPDVGVFPPLMEVWSTWCQGTKARIFPNWRDGIGVYPDYTSCLLDSSQRLKGNFSRTEETGAEEGLLPVHLFELRERMTARPAEGFLKEDAKSDAESPETQVQRKEDCASLKLKGETTDQGDFMLSLFGLVNPSGGIHSDTF